VHKLLAALTVLLVAACPALAQVPAGPAAEGGRPPDDFWFLLWFGAGWFGFAVMVLLVLCSVAVLALVIEHFLNIRRSVLAPVELADEVYHHVNQGELAEAEQLCKRQPGFLSSILLAGVGEARHGYEAVEKALEEEAQTQNGRLHRKIDYLNLLSSIGPMLGLLGTVWGMVVAFQRVAETQGRANPGELAGGIYQALYTTVIGLLIAIPGLACYGVLRNRVDQLSVEASVLAEKVFAPLKRGRPVRRAAETAAGRGS
jgi:biopolymer transport protein ExbB